MPKVGCEPMFEVGGVFDSIGDWPEHKGIAHDIGQPPRKLRDRQREGTLDGRQDVLLVREVSFTDFTVLRQPLMLGGQAIRLSHR